MTDRRRILVTDPDDPPAGGEVLVYDAGADAVTGAGIPRGELLIRSEPASPLTFDDILQDSEGTALLYAPL